MYAPGRDHSLSINKAMDVKSKSFRIFVVVVCLVLCFPFFFYLEVPNNHFNPLFALAGDAPGRNHSLSINKAIDVKSKYFRIFVVVVFPVLCFPFFFYLKVLNNILTLFLPWQATRLVATILSQ